MKPFTLGQLRDQEPCALGWSTLIKGMGCCPYDKDVYKDVAVTLDDVVKHCGLSDAAWCVRPELLGRDAIGSMFVFAIAVGEAYGDIIHRGLESGDEGLQNQYTYYRATLRNLQYIYSELKSVDFDLDEAINFRRKANQISAMWQENRVDNNFLSSILIERYLFAAHVFLDEPFGGLNILMPNVNDLKSVFEGEMSEAIYAELSEIAIAIDLKFKRLFIGE